MACYHPLDAWRTRGGDITFRAGHGVGVTIKLPCGQCIGCRLERSRQWAMRCLYESELHEDNCFVTLTYSDDFLPEDGGLRKVDFQRFMKRLRREIAPRRIRFFHCGEYGDQLGRPHYHALIFGYDAPDKELIRDGKNPLFSSKILSRLWGRGHVSVGALTFESAAYCARYCLKKRTGKGSDKHYERVIPETGEVVLLHPEYTTMSLKPAIGKGWYDKFSTDVFPSDFLVVRGNRVRPPKYFDLLFKRDAPEEFERIRLKRVRKASTIPLTEKSVERLKVCETVVKARTKLFSKRDKEF